MWEEWVLDVTNPDILCFVPYEEERFVFGMNVISDKCPGKLVGIIHEGGQEAVEQWQKDNPDWAEKFSKEDK